MRAGGSSSGIELNSSGIGPAHYSRTAALAAAAHDRRRGRLLASTLIAAAKEARSMSKSSSRSSLAPATCSRASLVTTSCRPICPTPAGSAIASPMRGTSPRPTRTASQAYEDMTPSCCKLIHAPPGSDAKCVVGTKLRGTVHLQCKSGSVAVTDRAAAANLIASKNLRIAELEEELHQTTTALANQVEGLLGDNAHLKELVRRIRPSRHDGSSLLSSSGVDGVPSGVAQRLARDLEVERERVAVLSSRVRELESMLLLAGREGGAATRSALQAAPSSARLLSPSRSLSIPATPTRSHKAASGQQLSFADEVHMDKASRNASPRGLSPRRSSPRRRVGARRKVPAVVARLSAVRAARAASSDADGEEAVVPTTAVRASASTAPTGSRTGEAAPPLRRDGAPTARKGRHRSALRRSNQLHSRGSSWERPGVDPLDTHCSAEMAELTQEKGKNERPVRPESPIPPSVAEIRSLMKGLNASELSSAAAHELPVTLHGIEAPPSLLGEEDSALLRAEALAIATDTEAVRPEEAEADHSTVDKDPILAAIAKLSRIAVGRAVPELVVEAHIDGVPYDHPPVRDEHFEGDDDLIAKVPVLTTTPASPVLDAKKSLSLQLQLNNLQVEKEPGSTTSIPPEARTYRRESTFSETSAGAYGRTSSMELGKARSPRSSTNKLPPSPSAIARQMSSSFNSAPPPDILSAKVPKTESVLPLEMKKKVLINEPLVAAGLESIDRNACASGLSSEDDDDEPGKGEFTSPGIRKPPFQPNVPWEVRVMNKNLSEADSSGALVGPRRSETPAHSSPGRFGFLSSIFKRSFSSESKTRDKKRLSGYQMP